MSVAPEPTKLELVVQSSGVQSETALVINAAMSPFFLQAQEWQSKVAEVTDPKIARASRLVLKKIRVEAGHKKDELKENTLKLGRAIDAAFRTIEDTIAPMEDTLSGIETAAERAEAARKAKVKEDREAALKPFGVNTAFFDLAGMTDDVFAELLSEKKAAFEARAETARKAEVERIAREQAEAEERARIKLENERLRREAAEREQTARAERERMELERKAAEDKARAEREAIQAKADEERRAAAAVAKAAADNARKEREAIEAKAQAEAKAASDKARKEREAVEAQARKERELREAAEERERAARRAETARIAAEEEARRQATLAPDREKLMQLAKQVRAIVIPKLVSPEAETLGERIEESLSGIANWIETEGGDL